MKLENLKHVYCAHAKRMSCVIAMTKEQHSLIDYLMDDKQQQEQPSTMLQVIGTTAAAALVAQRYSNNISPRRCC